MKQPLKIKDLLKERSDKPQFYISHYYNGVDTIATRIKDSKNFSLGQIYLTTSEGNWVIQYFNRDEIHVAIFNDITGEVIHAPIDNLYSYGETLPKSQMELLT